MIFIAKTGKPPSNNGKFVFEASLGKNCSHSTGTSVRHYGEIFNEE